ncbi:hypothetical protein JHW43_004263 [Diplocarpon mali]|nr:hypothetical protein JHW43_004263 [Diplocarpon mali]
MTPAGMSLGQVTNSHRNAHPGRATVRQQGHPAGLVRARPRRTWGGGSVGSSADAVLGKSNHCSVRGGDDEHGRVLVEMQSFSTCDLSLPRRGQASQPSSRRPRERPPGGEKKAPTRSARSMDEGAPERHTSRRPPSGPPGSSGVDLGSEKRRGRIRAAPTDSTIRWMQEDTKAGPRIRGLAGTNCAQRAGVGIRRAGMSPEPGDDDESTAASARSDEENDGQISRSLRGHLPPPPGLDVHGFHRMPHPGAHVWRARKWRDRREVSGEEVLVYRKCVLLAWGFVLS